MHQSEQSSAAKEDMGESSLGKRKRVPDDYAQKVRSEVISAGRGAWSIGIKNSFSDTLNSQPTSHSLAGIRAIENEFRSNPQIYPQPVRESFNNVSQEFKGGLPFEDQLSHTFGSNFTELPPDFAKSAINKALKCGAEENDRAMQDTFVKALQSLNADDVPFAVQEINGLLSKGPPQLKQIFENAIKIESSSEGPQEKKLRGASAAQSGLESLPPPSSRVLSETEEEGLLRKCERSKHFAEISRSFLRERRQPDKVIEFDYDFMEDLVDFWNAKSPVKCSLVKNVEKVGDVIEKFQRESPPSQPNMQFAIVGYNAENSKIGFPKHYQLMSMYKDPNGQSSIKVYESTMFPAGVTLNKSEMQSNQDYHDLLKALPSADKYSFQPQGKNLEGKDVISVTCEQGDKTEERIVEKSYFPKASQALDKLFQEYHSFHPYAQAVKQHGITSLAFIQGFTNFSPVDCGINSFYQMKTSNENIHDEVEDHKNLLQGNLGHFRHDQATRSAYEEFLQRPENKVHAQRYRNFQEDVNFAAREYPDMQERLHVLYGPLHQKNWNYKINHSRGNLNHAIAARAYLGDKNFGEKSVAQGEKEGKGIGIQEYHNANQVSHHPQENTPYNGFSEFYRSQLGGEMHEFYEDKKIEKGIAKERTALSTHGLRPQALTSRERESLGITYKIPSSPLRQR